MTSLFTMIAEREADARTAAEDLRAQITKLSEQLTAVKTELSRLQVTRETAIALGYTEPDNVGYWERVVEQTPMSRVWLELAHRVGSQALRAMLNDCSPSCCTQPATTS